MGKLISLPFESASNKSRASTIKHYFGRRGLILLAGAAVAAGLILNWSSLVAAGVAPLLIAVAPCAAMCALGLCTNKRGSKSCASESSGVTTNSASKAVSAKAREEV